MASCLLNTLALERVLLQDGTIADCAVRSREHVNGRSVLVAYIVPSGAWSAEALRSRLMPALSDTSLPIVFLPVNCLPLTCEGTVDEVALGSVQIVDEQLARTCEEELRSLPGVGEVVVTVEEVPTARPPLHLSDLLPDFRNLAESLTEAPRTEKRALSTTRTASPVLALSEGEPLAGPAELPPTFPIALQRAVERNPDHGILYIDADLSEHPQSYAELLAEAEGILGGLRGLGLKPGDKVIFQLERNQDFLPAFWACALGGFVPVPVSIAANYREKNAAVTKLQHAWQMLDKPVVLCGDALAEEVMGVADLLNMEGLRLSRIGDLRRQARDRSWHPSQPDDTVLMLLTSGSTGLPKGVMLTHRNILWRSAATAQMNNFTDREISLNWFPLDHVGGLVMYHSLDVYLGSGQIHVPTDCILQNPLLWLDLIHKHRVSSTWAPNFAFGLINDHANQVKQKQWDLSCLQFILNGGEAIVPRTAKRFLELLAPHGLPPGAMHPSWGMSETCSGVVFSQLHAAGISVSDSFVEVGPPLPGVRLRIVDGQDRIVPEAVIGRLQISGPTVTRGYYNNDELNHESFSADGWFNTGDLAILKERRLTITGRSKDVIIVNGVNFYSHDIEAVVEEVDRVEASFAAATAVREPGTNTDKVAIFYVPSAGYSDSQAALVQAIRTQVARGIGVSADYVVPVGKEDIPKTAIGKIQRSVLRTRFEQGDFKEIIKRLDIETASASTVPDWFYQRVWRRQEPASVTESAGTLVLLDDAGLGAAICDWLSANKQSYATAAAAGQWTRSKPGCYGIDPADPAGLACLLRAVKEDGLAVDRIVDCRGYAGRLPQDGRQRSDGPQILSLVQALVKANSSQGRVGLYALTRRMQPVQPSDEIDWQKAEVLGILKAAPQELPWLGCRSVDLEGIDLRHDADCVVREFGIRQADREVAYRAGKRFVPVMEHASLTTPSTTGAPFYAGGTYAISGGLGGIALTLAAHLLKTHGARVLLLGTVDLPRAEWPERAKQAGAIGEKCKALLELQAYGDALQYRAADVTNLEQLRAAVTEAETGWGRKLDGVIHLAGIYRERMLTEETADSFAESLRAKVDGARNLAALLSERPEAMFLAFSSVASFFGGAGIAAYCSANETLEHFCAQLRRQRPGITRCFSWTSWDGIGMSRGYREVGSARGYQPIPTRKAISSLLAGLYAGEPHLFVGLDDQNRAIRRFVKGECSPVQSMTAYYTMATDGIAESEVAKRAASWRCRPVRVPELPRTVDGQVERSRLATAALRQGESARMIEPANELERRVAAAWVEILGVSRVSMSDRFFEAGGDSLLGIRLINRLRDVLGVELSLRTLFAHPGLQELADHVTAQLTSPAPAEPPSVQLTAASKPIEQLSDEEVESLLAELAGQQGAGDER